MTGSSLNIGFRAPELSLHPVLDIVTGLKKRDNSVEEFEKKYDIYISMLKFTYEIVLNNEFIFDQYPNEKYVKLFYATNMTGIHRDIDEGGELIRQAYLGNYMWRPETLKALQKYLKDNKGRSVFYSNFIDDLFTVVYKNILEDYDKMLFAPTLMEKKWKIGSYLLKITDTLLQRFIVNLERVYIISENPSENCLFTHIIHHLNNSKISDFILRTLEVVIHRELLKTNKFGDGFNPLGIENKYWMTYILNQETNGKQIRNLREMIYDVFFFLLNYLQNKNVCYF